MKIAFLNDPWPGQDKFLDKDIEWVSVTSQADRTYTAESLAKLAGVDAILSGTHPCNAQVFEAATDLKMVQAMGVGYDNVDLAEATKRGVLVCNNAGVNKASVAEYNMMHILMHAKQVMEAHHLTAGAGWEPRRDIAQQSMELAGRVLGIVGFGNTGTSLAKRAKAFEMEILYNDIKEVDPETVRATGARFVEKDELFSQADVVSICTDLNDQSRGMVDARRIGLMKPDALFICCARGNIVDEKALRKALDAGNIAGAGMDVFEHEPIRPDNPLLGAPRVTLTPHLAGVNPQTHERSMRWSMDNCRRLVERDERPERIVNGL